MTEKTGPGNVEQGAILACLSGIRWRLYGVRLGERAALALGWSAMVGLAITGARILNDRIPLLGMLLAALPVVAGVWLFWKSPVLGRESSLLARRAGLRVDLLRLAGILTVSIGIAA